MENRRNFFKGIALFASGIFVSKINAMVPKKEEKEELMVSEKIIINHEGEDYHPVVVKKKSKLMGDLSNIPRNNGIISPLDLRNAPTAGSGSMDNKVVAFRQHTPPEPQIRKLNK